MLVYVVGTAVIVPLSEVVIFSVLIESFHCVYEAVTYILINTMFIQCCHS